MTHKELIMLQSLPLEIKVMKTKARIEEAINRFGINGVYVSYSGGKDSEVLLDIARQIDPRIKAVFSNTGQEYPETVKQVMMRKKQGYDIDIVKPKIRYVDVIRKYGYPVVSKENAQKISEAKNTKSEKLLEIRMNGNEKGHGKLPEKWKYLIECDFKISDKCCKILKKQPMEDYKKETGRTPIVGTMAGESRRRKTSYLQTGCNSFEGTRPMSRPLGFWKESDVWEYIKVNNLQISEMYTKHGASRTGCYGCLFGCHIEEQQTGTNRIVKLKETHPKLYNYLMEELNYKHVMEVLGLKTKPDYVPSNINTDYKIESEKKQITMF